MLYNVIVGIARVLITLFCWPKVKNIQNLDDVGGKIIICSHRYWWDPVLVAVCCKSQLNFMAKEELFENPILGFILPKINAFPIKRGSADVKAIKNSIKLLEDKKTLLIFPEGTRNKVHDGEMLEFHKGAAFLAVKANADIVPIYIVKRRIKGRINATVGDTISTSSAIEGVPKREQADRLTDVIVEKMTQLKQLSEGK